MNFKLFIGFIAIFYSNVNAQVDTIYPSTTHQSDLGVFSISRRSYHYTDLTSGSNYNAFINQKRVSDNGIKSCREIKYEIRGKHRTIDYPIYVYHYDTLGYCYLRDKIDENGNIHKSHWEDTAGLHLDPLWRDSMEWIVTNYVGKRFDDLDKVYWSGYGTLMANQDKRFRLVSSKMVDSIKLVNTYRGKGSSAEDSLIYTYNTNGILVEINAFSKNGFSLYTRRRFKIENGFATEFEEKVVI
ncbi:MAG: hypothetical protein R2784_21290 [Saprospiraceae bacterium]